MTGRGLGNNAVREVKPWHESANTKVPKVLRHIRTLRRLVGRRHMPPTDEQVSRLIGLLAAEVDAIRTVWEEARSASVSELFQPVRR